MVISKGKVKINQKEIDSITFQVEELERPSKLLEEHTIQEILSKFSSQIEAHSDTEKTLVSNGFHSFLYGMYQSYAEHRPFTLSPDMIWLLICQGFSRHINFNKGTENEVFPHLNTKQSIEITYNQSEWKNDSKNWVDSINKFTEEIDKKVGDKLIETLKGDFSTTGINERVVNKITIMDSMKPYFEYILNLCICGIPEITIEGSTEDWEKILDKLSGLKKYNLNWWICKLEPIIKEFILASKGIINNSFWINMFKVHQIDDYGDPQYIDGWITNFYPYYRRGRLTNFSEMKMLTVDFICDELPKELVCVDFFLRIIDSQGNILKQTSMEYWAGFIGLKQCKESLSLRPEIGWFICHKNNSISNESKHNEVSDSRVYYNLKSFPKEILKTKELGFLILNFKDQIEIPLSILKLSIAKLTLNGRLRKRDQFKITLLKRKFHIELNGKEI